MDCSTHKSILVFTTCYPKIHLNTHSRMCRSQEWGLMRAGWPSHHFSPAVFWQHTPRSALPANACRPLRHSTRKRMPSIPGSFSFCPPSLSSPPSGRQRNGINGASAAHKCHRHCWVVVPHAAALLTWPNTPTPSYLSAPQGGTGQQAGHVATSSSAWWAGP